MSYNQEDYNDEKDKSHSKVLKIMGTPIFPILTGFECVPFLNNASLISLVRTILGFRGGTKDKVTLDLPSNFGKIYTGKVVSRSRAADRASSGPGFSS
jgi:hypothetical protein